MAQDGTTAGGASYTLDNVTFPVGRNKLQSIFDAIRSTNKGNTAPDLVAGQFWIDDNTPSTTVWTLYFFDGTDSISFATIDTINNTVNFIDSTFTQLTSDLDTNGNDINFGDNDKAQFGASQDLQIYHDGSNSYIQDNGTGALILEGTTSTQIKGSTFVILRSNDGENMAVGNANGSFDLYYNNSKKFETTNTGIDVTGTVVSDGLTVDGSVAFNTGAITHTTAGNPTYTLDNTDGSSLEIAAYNAQARLDVTSDIHPLEFYTGGTITQKLDANGDISFYEDTGTTPKLFWDASAESLGIGTSSPQYRIESVGTNAGGEVTGLAVRNNAITAGGSVSIYFVNSTDPISGANRTKISSIRNAVGDHDLAFYTNDGTLTERMRIDSSGNVGIGTTPQIHYTGYTALDLGASGSIWSNRTTADTNTIMMANNAYLNSGATNSIRIHADEATRYAQANGTHTWSYAASSTAGSVITWSEAMRIDSSGNVGIGVVPENSSGTWRNLQFGGGNLAFRNGGNNDTMIGTGYLFKTDNSEVYKNTEAVSRLFFDNNSMIFQQAASGTAGTAISWSEAMRIDSSGNVGIGTSSPIAELHIADSSANAVLRLESSDTGSGEINFDDQSAVSRGRIIYDHSDNSMRLITTNSERMRIDSSGKVGINETNPSSLLNIVSNSSLASNAQLSWFQDAENRIGNYRQNTNATFTNYLTLMYTTRTGGSTFDFLRMASNSAIDNEFRFRGDGEALADGSFTGGGADYAEYFEWSDGNTSNENRVGYSVVLDNNKIRKATDTDNVSEIIGVISANPVVVGDASWNKWTNKHLKDDFGSYIWEEHNVVEWIEQELVEEAKDEVYDAEGNLVEEAKEAVYKEKKHSYEDWNIPEGIIVPDNAETKTHDDKGNRFKHRKVNPEYDSNFEYIPREERKEWDTVGLMGKLRIRKGQPVGDRWIKMRDISDTVEEWLIR